MSYLFNLGPLTVITLLPSAKLTDLGLQSPRQKISSPLPYNMRMTIESHSQVPFSRRGD